jgi:hypothetical protein
VEAGTGPVGTVSGQWTIPGGEHFSTATYVLTNGVTTYQGTLQVTSASTYSFVIGSVDMGTGYHLSLSTTSDDQYVACSGTTGAFNVGEGATTLVNLQVACTAGGDAGSLIVRGVSSNCPLWTSIVVNPDTASAGSPVQLSATAVAPDPGSLTFQWAASAGTIGPGTLADAGFDTTTFTCPDTPGIVAINLILSDGNLPEGGGCDVQGSRVTFSVHCVAPPACSTPGAGCGDGGQICTSAGNCVAARFAVVVLDGLDGGPIDNSGAFLPMSIQQFDLGGDPIGSPIVLPTSSIGAQQPISIAGNNVTEGDLNASVTGNYLVTTGWNLTPGAQPDSTTQAVVARISTSGSVDTSTLVPGAFLPLLSARSAVTQDGTGFWVSGAAASTATGNAGGVWYVPFGGAGTPTQLLSMPDGVSTPNEYVRWLRNSGGMLFGGFDGVHYLSYLGNLPTSGTVTPNPLPGGFASYTGPTPSPYGFLMFNLFGNVGGPDTIYIADDGIDPVGAGDTAGSGSMATGGGGLSKWTFTQASGWSQVWSINAGTWGADAGVLAGGPIGFRGLAGFATGSQVTLMATTADTGAAPNSLAVVFVDNSNGTMPTSTIVASSGPGQVFRGVALTPQ